MTIVPRPQPWRPVHPSPTDAGLVYEWRPKDLAPGDRVSVGLEVRGFTAHRIIDAGDPLYRTGFETLWKEFGHLNEMEPEAVIRERLRRDLRRASPRCSTLYEMCVLEHEGRILGVRDHTAILRMHRGRVAGVVVHLSHMLLLATARETGLAGWMRAFPMQTVRRALGLAGAQAGEAPVVFVGEMEAPKESRPLTEYRLRSCQKAGFRAIDPAGFPYHQPDFRAPSVIDHEGGPRPVPLRLVIRRVGREMEQGLAWREALEIADALYDMYQADYKEGDIAPLRVLLRKASAGLDSPLALVDPTV